MAVDGSGNVWATNGATNKVYVLVGNPLLHQEAVTATHDP